jgi:8-oxo-dGTP pyrophosphatase MutT (NUDIX family)/ribosomal protein S18 acetylase RimI-like enzyme
VNGEIKVSEPERSFGSVIYRITNGKTEYLAVKSQTTKKHWGFPKGHATKGETGIQTAIREVFEETGIKISIRDDLTAYERYILCGNIHKEVTFYIANAGGQQVTVQPSEIADFRWGGFEEIYNLLTYSNSRNVLCRAELYLNGGKGIEYREISYDEITEDFLSGFDRYEEIEKAWREEQGRVILKDIKYTEYWDDNELKKVSEELKGILLQGGSVFAAYFKNTIIGIAALDNHFFGSSSQYIQLSMLHISRNFRGIGIGKELFKLSQRKAKHMGAQKMYISASSCENAQIFYSRLGCLPAREINPVLYKLEPFDRHLEYVL